MASNKQRIKINSIFEGVSPAQYFGSEGTYNSSIGIDPDAPIISTDIRTSGFVVPVAYAKFSGSNVNASVVAIMNNPIDALTYVALSTGRLISYSSSLGSETVIASTFTVTIASPAVFTLTGHGLSAGDIVYFTTTGALPTGLTAGTAYYVISTGLTANAFQVSTTSGGTAVNTSGTQSGTHSITMACYGAEYYNNYIWLFTGTNVSRYGPLSSSPALIHNTWQSSTAYTGTAGGFNLTAFTNTAYPSFRTVSIPNHPTHVHSDNALYFGDFKNGQGYINKIAVKTTTVQGDTNNSSSYQSLALPYGFYPTAIETYGVYLMILGLFSNDTTGPVNQGRAAFILWDVTNTITFSLIGYLQDPIGTALKNVNGEVYVWTGNASGGVRLSKYIGGQYTREVCFQEEGLPPFCYAVDSLGSRVIWGGFTTNPAISGSVWAWGSKDGRLPAGLHNIILSSSTGSSPIVTALRYVQQANNSLPRAVVASTDGSGSQIDKFSATASLQTTGTQQCTIRWMFNIGQKFYIDRIMFPLAGAVNSTTSIVPKVYFDELSTTKTLATINNTNYSAKRKVLFKGAELKDYTGQNNFVLELTWSNTNPLAVGLPITIDYHIVEDEPV